MYDYYRAALTDGWRFDVLSIISICGDAVKPIQPDEKYIVVLMPLSEKTKDKRISCTHNLQFRKRNGQ